jgi:hypothetical protein
MAWILELENLVATSANSRQTIEAVSEAARARSLSK